MAGEAARFTVEADGPAWRLALAGRWLTGHVAPVDAPLRSAKPDRGRPAVVDLTRVEAMDTAGAWLVHRSLREWRRAGFAAEMTGGSDAVRRLIDTVGRLDAKCPDPPPPVNALAAIIGRTGKSTITILNEAGALLSFLGVTLTALLSSLVRPRRIRLTALFFHLENTGLNALPIVGLISFLVGVVLAFQGADQLSRFGAEIFTVNLVGIGVLREMGVLLTAIIVAGRSGSAFTAQIGTMKVNEEVAAMQVMGLDPIDVLVMPRVIALMITLPLLTFYADLMGLAGGAVMATLVLDISVFQFIRQLNDAVPLSAYWVGLVKAPVFAFVIALVGCFEGLRVEGSAESVGTLTTRSVVESIFLVITLDAAFSVFFAVIGI